MTSMDSLRARLLPRFGSRPLQLACMVLMLLIMIVLLYQMYRHAYRPHKYDLADRLNAARLLLDGRSPYENLDPHWPYVYPLFYAFIMIPVAIFPYAIANGLWFALSAGMLVWCARLIVSLGREETGVVWGRAIVVPLTIVFLLSVRWIQNHYVNGQVDLLVLLCCLLFYAAYVRGQKDRAALFLAAGIAIKIFPIVFMLFLLLRRQFRIIVVATLLTILFVTFPAVLVDGRSAIDLFREYIATFVAPRLARTATGQYTPIGFLQYFLPELSRTTHLVLTVCSALLVVAPLGMLERRALQLKHSSREIWMIVLYLLIIPLLSPLSETHHLAMILPATLLLTFVFLYRPENMPSTAVNLFLVSTLLFLIARSLAPELSELLGKRDRVGPLFFPALATLYASVALVFLNRTRLHGVAR